MHKGSYKGLNQGQVHGQFSGLSKGLVKGSVRNDRKQRRIGIDAEWANSANEVMFIFQGDSTSSVDSNNSTGAGPSNNGKIWNGSKFIPLGTVGPGDSGDMVGRVDGTMLQQFALSYYTRTGKIACFVASGIGGTKCFDTWDGVSSTFTTSIATAKKAQIAGNFPKVRFILASLVNDSTAGDTLATVNANFNAWINAINTAFPTTVIYYIMFGVKSGQTTRAQNLRCNVREKWISTPNLHITHSDLYLADWGLIGADGVHRTQTGHNFTAAKVDSYLAMESLGYNKFARTAINSYYSTLGPSDAIEYNRLISGCISDGDWHNLTSIWVFDLPDANDRFVDLALLSRLTDRGVTFTTESHIATASGQTLNIPCTPQAITYRTHSNTDTFISVRIGASVAAAGGTTKIMAGVSTGTNIFAAQMSAAGLITFFCWSSSGPTKSGGVQSNTQYSWGREGTAAPGGAGGDVVSWINGVENARTTVAAGAANTTGPEIGDRYTAGPAGFPLPEDVKYVIMGLPSAVNQLRVYNRFETFLSRI